MVRVFAAFVLDRGHAFIGHRLYLPEAWTGDPARMRTTYVPEAITVATRLKLALAMIEWTLQAEVPFAEVAADSIYGVAKSSWRCGPPTRATCSASPVGIASGPGTQTSMSRASTRRSPTTFPIGTSGASRPVLAARERAYSTGPLCRWPRFRLTRSTARSFRACGRATYWGGAACRTGH